MLAVGGNDGNIRLLDPRLRSTAVEHLLTVHTGPVQALAVTPTDGLKVCSFFPPLVACTTRLGWAGLDILHYYVVFALVFATA